MKIGIALPHAPDDRLFEIARRAEALGFDSIWQGEHIVLPMVDRHEHPYGKIKIAPQNPFHAPFVQLAALAAVTTTLRVCTGVILPPLRNVFATAREITSLDIMSGGRLDVGIGVGWHPDEFELMGYDFKARGAYTDEFIDALSLLLDEREPGFQGKHISFESVGFEPKPLQRPRPPILVGGDTPLAQRRAAKRGDGWYGHADSPEQALERLEAVNRHVEAEGRDPASFKHVVQVWNPPEEPEAYFAAGADRLVVMPFRPDTDPIEQIEAYATKINLRARKADDAKPDALT